MEENYPVCPYDCPCYKVGECKGGEYIKYCNIRLESECQNEDLSEID